MIKKIREVVQMIQRVQMVLGQKYEIIVDLVKNVCSTQKRGEVKTFPIFKDNEFKYAERVIHPSDINNYGIDFWEEEIYYAVCFRIREYEYDHLLHKINWSKKRWWWLPNHKKVADYIDQNKILDLSNALLIDMRSKWYAQTYNNNEMVHDLTSRLKSSIFSTETIKKSFYNVDNWSSGELHRSKTFLFDAGILLLYGIGILDYNTIDIDVHDEEIQPLVKDYISQIKAIHANKTHRYQKKTAIVTYYSQHMPTLVTGSFGQIMIITNKNNKNLEKILRQTIFFSPTDKLVIH